MNIIHRILVCLAAIPCFASPEMTLEEKIGQLLMVHFNGKEINEDAKTLIQKVHVGGIIYYNWANGLDNPEQVSSLSKDLQQLARDNRIAVPLLIAADQECGLISRIHGLTVFPGNWALGKTKDPNLAEESAFAIGQELMAVGVNMNLAPVADVNNNPRNPVIGIRSFSDRPEDVAIFARKTLDGYHRAGIITSLKHFPGHGDVEVDSHENLVFINKSIEELTKNELLPFFRLSDQADTVITAHLMVPAIDRENCATLSKDIISLLRNKIGFQGVIITDSLVMDGVLKNCNHSVEEAAIRAFNAGHDILLLGGKQLQGTDEGFELTVRDVQKIHQALINAVRSHRISEERVNQSVERILNLKKRYELSSSKWQSPAISAFNHQELAKKIADLSIQTIQNKTIPPFHGSHIALFAPELVRESISQTSLGKTNALFFKTLNPSDEETIAAKKSAEKADIIVFCCYNAWKNSAQLSLIKLLYGSQKPMVLIALRDPLDASLFPDMPVIISTFSPTAPSIQAACDQLKIE